MIIPTYRRYARLAACLRSLANCDFPRQHFEVIVVDLASGAPPRGVLAPFSGQIELAMIELGMGGLASARNAGAKHAQGEYLAFIDDDCAPTSDWLTALSSQVSPESGWAVSGKTVNALPNKLTSEATQALLDYRALHYRRDAHQVSIFSASNLAVAAADFRELGGFDESIPHTQGSERDFCDRWVSSGRKIIYNDEAVVLDAHTPSLSSFLRYHFDDGVGAFEFSRARARREEVTLPREQLNFRELVSYPYARRAGWRAPFLSTLIAVAQFTSSFGYFTARWRTSR